MLNSPPVVFATQYKGEQDTAGLLVGGTEITWSKLSATESYWHQ
jgi:hypothetical protein